MTASMNRRTALALLGAGVVSSRLPAAQAQLHAIRKNTEPPKLMFFDHSGHQLIEALAENIIPADEHSPGARAARVSYYIDLVAANSALPVQKTWRTEMSAFEDAARQELGKPYLEADPAGQIRFLSKLSSAPAGTKTPAEQFFARMKQMTIFGYYTSETGLLQELEYKGNKALAEFPGCKTHADEK
jgi:glucoside 3-dehydrogenase (cytochrome c) hitch-hiker subunit